MTGGSPDSAKGEIMIDALIAGKLCGSAAERTAASSGRQFVTAKVRAADSEGEGQFVNVVAFDDSVKTALLALGDGDSVALTGAMKIGTYEARDGTTRININLVASAALSAYHVRKRRAAVQQASGPEPEQPARATAAGKHGEPEASLYGDSGATIDDDVSSF
jgi:single-stranded DNA-binding protein